ncbi:LOW QUALITY PROTEIN: potassium channel subfamily U member 1 [Cariama cristata]
MAGKFNLTCALSFQLAFIIPSLFSLRGLFTILASRLARKQSSVYWIVFSMQVEMMLSAQTSMGTEEFKISSFPDSILYMATGFNAFFLLYFGLRFVAADDKLRFWLELNSLVDFFMISPVFISYFLKRNWLGLSYSIKFSKLLAVFIKHLLTAAGFVHLVESNGDPWAPANSQSLSYFKCMYLVMMTISTDGYGDMVQTILVTFTIFFIIGGLGCIVELIESHKNYKSSYEVVSGKNCIVVCGNITLENVTAFLGDFLLWDKGNVCTEILFLGESFPSLELEAVFKCYSTYMISFYGSALNLKRVGMESANAFLILEDVHSPQPDTEDTSNIMRVLSIKNHFQNTRVIFIIQSYSIIYFAELELGSVEQSYLDPGLSSLLTDSLIVKEEVLMAKENSRDILHSTGMFHWCDAVPLQEALLSCKDQTTLNLQDHVLVCIFDDANSPLTGLQDFVMPLRASNFIYHELKNIVFLRSLKYLHLFRNFPKLWLFSGSALGSAVLRAVNVQDCTACTILSSSTTASSSPSLVHMENAVFRARALGNQSQPCYKRISITTELKPSPNAQFISQVPSGNSEIPEQDQLFTTDAPAGPIFLDSFLNLLLSMTYCNHHILALLQTLVTSEMSPALGEQLLEEGNRLHRSPDNVIHNASQISCTLTLLLLSKRLLTGVTQDSSFGDIYCSALDLFGILCFGLYHLLEEPNPYKNRQG